MAGGVCVTLDEFGLTTQVLLAQDPLIIGAVHRRAAQMGTPCGRACSGTWPSHKLNTVETVAGRLSARSRIAAGRLVDRRGAQGACNRATRSLRRAMRPAPP